MYDESWLTHDKQNLHYNRPVKAHNPLFYITLYHKRISLGKRSTS